jgi:inner membrane protein
MQGVAHALIGASVGVVLAGGVHQEAWPLIAIAAGSALLPDLDVRTSTASNWFRNGVSLGSVALSLGATGVAWQRTHDPLIAAGAAVLTSVMVPIVLSLLAPWRWFEHRGPFHSIPMALLVGAIAYLVSGRTDIAIALIAGWSSHLVADDLTYMGQPLLWPLSSKLVHVTPRTVRFRSGSWIEWPIAACVMLLAIHPHMP